MIDFHSFHDACEAALREHHTCSPLLFPSTSLFSSSFMVITHFDVIHVQCDGKVLLHELRMKAIRSVYLRKFQVHLYKEHHVEFFILIFIYPVSAELSNSTVSIGFLPFYVSILLQLFK
jgi:hypothetical protein